MINLRTRKIIRDIWDNKARTFLVVLTIALSIFSVGNMGRIWFIMSSNMTNTFLAANPTSATLVTHSSFDEALEKQVARLADVRDVEAVNIIGGRIQVGPNRWRSLKLIARSDYDQLRIDKIVSETGIWPPADDTILVERTSLALLPVELGDTVTVELDNRREPLTLAGTVHDVTQISSSFSLVVYGYVTQKTFQKLTDKEGYSHLNITVADNRFDKAHIKNVVGQVTDVMESNGEIVVRKDVPPPGKHPLDNIMQSVLTLLASMTVLGMLLGVFLVINIISAQLLQQTQQIGIIKAVGGESRQVIVMYFKAVLLFGLLAFSVTLPLTIIVSRTNSALFAGLINFDVVSFDVTIWNVLAELTAGFILPCLAALYPILKAARLTVRETISYSGGQDMKFGAGRFESLLSQIPNLPSLVLYPFRNIFRRKVRLILAMITLSIAGAIWIAVGSVRASLRVTVDEVSQYWQEDINVIFGETVNYGQIERIIGNVEGINHIEPRLNKHVFRVRPDGAESIDGIDLFGLDPASSFIKPRLLEGRWLQPDDTNAIVINTDLLKIEPDIAVGDEITLKVEERETDWQVVGISTSQVIGGSELLNSPIAYASYDHLTRAVHASWRIDRVMIDASPGRIEQIVSELETRFAERGINLNVILIQTDLRRALDSSFNIVLTVLQITSVIFGLVGGLGLTSMMTLNVMERTREIGIIRSVGGDRQQLSQIIVTEGVFVGVISWILAVIMAYPLSIGLGNAVGSALLGTSLTHSFPLIHPLIWLVVVIVLSVISSLIPGYNAARLSVREAVSFE